MTSLESIERLRDCTWIGGGKVNEYLDEIEREIAEKYMELPVDKDGVPWHIGDMTENRNVVNGIVFDRHGAHFISTLNDIDPSIHTHFKQRTVEDVLREFGKAYTFVDGECANTHTLVATYANELRELIKEGEAV